MSNTSVVTPYESEESSSRGIGDVLGDVVGWLGDTDEDRAVDRRAKEANARQIAEDLSRRKQLAAVPVVSVNLHMKSADALLRSIPNAGYRIVQELPRPKADFLVLQGLSGDRVILEQTHGGGGRLHTVRSQAPINKIMRQNTLDRVADHQKKSGIRVESKTLVNGEVQMRVRGSSLPNGGELHVQVRNDGSSVLDVVGVHGPQCAQVVKEFAEATGGVLEQMIKKDEYYMLPGEVRREKVRTR